MHLSIDVYSFMENFKGILTFLKLILGLSFRSLD